MKKLKSILQKRLIRSVKEEDIDLEELKEKVRNGAILIDVRSIQEYRENHLNGAIQLDGYKIKSKIREIVNDLDKEIIVYCQNGGRSRRACKDLKKLGYKNVYNLNGGLENV